MTEKLIRVKNLHVPNDLNAGSEPECNESGVWMLPEHSNSMGTRCIGSGTLQYTTDLILETPFVQKAQCGFCPYVFSSPE